MFYVAALIAALINAEFVYRLMKFGFSANILIMISCALAASFGTAFALFEFSGRAPFPDSILIGGLAAVLKFIFFPNLKIPR